MATPTQGARRGAHEQLCPLFRAQRGQWPHILNDHPRSSFRRSSATTPQVMGHQPQNSDPADSHMKTCLVSYAIGALWCWTYGTMIPYAIGASRVTTEGKGRDQSCHSSLHLLAIHKQARPAEQDLLPFDRAARNSAQPKTNEASQAQVMHQRHKTPTPPNPQHSAPVPCNREGLYLVP
eukprot:365656-Chlamydomonas_euryale.AAC.3